jgi:hypothetical protein
MIYGQKENKFYSGKTLGYKTRMEGQFDKRDICKTIYQ